MIWAYFRSVFAVRSAAMRQHSHSQWHLPPPIEQPSGWRNLRLVVLTLVSFVLLQTLPLFDARGEMQLPGVEIGWTPWLLLKACALLLAAAATLGLESLLVLWRYRGTTTVHEDTWRID